MPPTFFTAATRPTSSGVQKHRTPHTIRKENIAINFQGDSHQRKLAWISMERQAANRP
jgi:hypothetical protein